MLVHYVEVHINNLYTTHSKHTYTAYRRKYSKRQSVVVSSLFRGVV